MKFYVCLFILLSDYLSASELELNGDEPYLAYVDRVVNFSVTEIEASPSGDFIYAGTSSSGNAATDSITVYSTNPFIGALTVEHSYTQGVDGVDGLTGINDIKITSDNSCLFVSSNKLIIPFGQDGHLASFAINSATGALTFVEAIDRLDPSNGNFTSPVKIALSGDNNFLYMSVSSEVLAFSVDTADCQLTYLESYSVTGGSTIGVGMAVDPSDEYLYVTVGNTGQPNSGGLALFQRDSLTGLLTQTDIFANGIGGIFDLENPVDIQITADGSYLYAASYDRDAVVVFTIDQLTGELTFATSYVNLMGGIDGLIQPRKLTLSADQRFLVVTGRWDDTLVAFVRDEQDGSLSFESSYYDDVDGFDHMAGVSDLLLSPHGFLYTAAVIDGAIQIIATNPGIIDVIFSDDFDGVE